MRQKIRHRAESKVRVLFLAQNTSKWKTQSVYEKLAGMDEFDPFVAIYARMDELDMTEDVQRKLLDDRKFYEALGDKVVLACDGETGAPKPLVDLSPDIVFYQEPWELPECFSVSEVSRYALCCYVPYSIECFAGAASTETLWALPSFHSLLYREFSWNDTDARERRKRTPFWRRAGKIVASGHPILDQYRHDESKEDGYVIYAPHYSIIYGKEDPPFKLSTFVETGRAVLEYAQKHREMNWLFKPHPRMYPLLIRSGFMTEQEVKDYYHAWEKIGTVCYDGNYVRLFNQSRAMITDSGSFLLEYAATGNPLIRLVPKTLNIWPNKAACGVIESHYVAHTIPEMLDLFKIILEERQDPRRERRRCETRKAMVFDSHSAENIVKELRQICK